MGILDNDLHWATLTEMVNNRPSKSTVLRDLLFSKSRTLPTETIALDTIEGDRSMAPFVKKNGEALYVTGLSTKRHMVEAPNIRIKRSFEPSELMDTRRTGALDIFPSRSEMVSARQRYIADEIDSMMDKIDHREEWMASQALRGSISYSDELGDAWQITFPRSSTQSINAPNGAWDSTHDIKKDIFHVSKVMSANQGYSPTICIMGETAANLFLADSVILADLDRSNYNIGSIDLKKYEGSGLLRLGRIMGIDFFVYPRQLPADGGGNYDLIRPTYAEFIHTGPGADNVAYYAAIPDMTANQRTGILEARRFSKAWFTEDPSSYTTLVHTRPLFVPRKPDAFFSMNVDF